MESEVRQVFRDILNFHYLENEHHDYLVEFQSKDEICDRLYVEVGLPRGFLEKLSLKIMYFVKSEDNSF